MNISKCIALAITTCVAILAQGQQPRYLTPANHLSSSLINEVFFSSDGYVWIATEDGLNKYDGSKITIYKHQIGDSTTLAHNFVNDIFEDKDGNIYVSSHKGLQKYDKATDAFSLIALSANGTPYGTSTSTLVQKSNGEIWVFGNQPFKVDTSGERLVLKPLNLPSEIDRSNVVIEDKEGNIWVAHDMNGIYRIAPNKTIKHYYGQEGDPLFTSFVMGNDNILYAGTFDKGLYRYDAHNDTFESLAFTSADASLNIKALYCDEHGNILIGTDGMGLKQFDPSTGQYSQMTVPMPNYDRLKVHSIAKDPHGNLWVGIFQKGVVMMPSIENDFNTLANSSFNPGIIGSACATTICRDSEQRLWVGTDNDGIYCLDKNMRYSRHFNSPDMPKAVLAIKEDKRGNLWVASYDKGAGIIDKETGSYRKVELADDKGIEVARVFDIDEDNNGNILFATMGSGIHVYDYHTGKVKYSKDINQSINPWLTSIDISPIDGCLYLGSFDGLHKVSPDHKVTQLERDVIIFAVYIDTERKCIWLATATGLQQMGFDGKIIKEYGTADGLPSNTLYAIEDDGDNLWIATNYGLSRFNVEKGTFTNFFYENGLQSNEFFKKSSFFDSKNMLMFFGGINGVTFFNPAKISSAGSKYDLRLTGFYIGEKAVKAGMKSGSHEIIDCPISQANTFHLSHDDNSFSVEFNVTQFTYSSHVEFLYSFDNSNWERLPHTNMRRTPIGGTILTFSNVKSGHHTLQIKAVDNGIESDPLKLTIIIDQVWYLTWWANLIYILLAIALIGGGVLLMRRKERQKEAELDRLHREQIKESKLQYFANISHEIRTPLSLVISPLKKLISNQNLSQDERQKEYRTMHRNATRILRLVNEIMDLRKIDNNQMKMRFQKVELRGLISDLYDTFAQAAANKNIDFTFHSEGCDDLQACVDLSSFDKIVMNLLSNAIKFTPNGGSVNITLSKGNDASTQGMGEYAEITVTDTGIGIAKEEREKVFVRFYQAANNNTSGTGIGLHLTHSLVQMHHGTIQIEDNPSGQGSRFVVRLPLHQVCDTTSNLQVEQKKSQEERQHARAIAADEASTPQADNSADNQKRNKRVYVVEDDAEVRNYLIDQLSSSYRVTAFPSGDSAFEAICRDVPDLIISDVMMPGMDGLTLTRKIRQNVNINHLPIILLTAKSTDTDNIEGLDSGADLYMTKPFNIDILSKNIQNLIEGHQRLRNVFSGSQSQTDKIDDIEAVSSDEKLLERVMKAVNKHISDSEITVEMIADEIGISRVHLHRKLKELTNQTTRDFIRNIRLQQAAKLLREKKLMVAEVSYLVGFKHPNNFSTNFKDMYGMSPTAYCEQFHGSEETPPAE